MSLKKIIFRKISKKDISREADSFVMRNCEFASSIVCAVAPFFS